LESRGKPPQSCHGQRYDHDEAEHEKSIQVVGEQGLKVDPRQEKEGGSPQPGLFEKAQGGQQKDR